MRTVDDIRADLAKLKWQRGPGVGKTAGAVLAEPAYRLADDVPELLARAERADSELAGVRKRLAVVEAAWMEVLQREQLGNNASLYDMGVVEAELDGARAELASLRADWAVLWRLAFGEDGIQPVGAGLSDDMGRLRKRAQNYNSEAGE